MENYFYKCQLCGFVHIVPAYWVSYNPEAEMEFEHVDLKLGEDCPCKLLQLASEEN